jgi:hypothetical protein
MKLSREDQQIELCESFRRVFSRWERRIGTVNVSSYDEASDDCDELRELRNTWGRCLAGIQEWRPKTLKGAQAKLDVAEMWSEWAGEFDCSALPFFAESKRELQSPGRPRLALSYWVADIKWRAHDWLARAPRSPWRIHD